MRQPLKGNAEFRNDVVRGTYDKWALEMSRTFPADAGDIQGTPTLLLDGRKITGPDGRAAPVTIEQFDLAIKGKYR
ncbi:thioredoxin domain-containing protein [Streptomyces sp. NPDC051561]|uniref:thioredoxin domain-containing protein n=1 Tax=Streptomyces sp. NPDC051561 TaxID=3365658 RepID=UPI00379262E0